MRTLLTVLAAVALSVVAAACGTVPAPGTGGSRSPGPRAAATRTPALPGGGKVHLDPGPVPIRAPGARVHVSVAGGCPQTDQSVAGVVNSGTDLRQRLLPAATPTAGLECRYYGLNGHPWQLRSRQVLSAAAAASLAESVARMPLSHATGGVVNCPMDDGSAEIIALSYPGRADVDLWVALTGCGGVSNGFIAAAGTFPP